MSFDVICFDCDSTLSKIEGIDELARRVGLGETMAKLTDAAMNGLVPLEDVYDKRLSLIRPDRAGIDWLAELYITEMVEGVVDVFKSLSTQNRQLHVISGGLRQAILPLAKVLGIKDAHVHAVDIYFNDDGSYRDFDRFSPLARTGGKAEICKRLLKPDSSLLMVGDGKTDMEAKQEGVTVIGFGGVADRPVVRELADHFVGGPALTPVLAYIL